MADTLKLGKLPAQRVFGVENLDAYYRSKPPTPPPSSPVPVVGNWGMLCNDRLGCCVISGCGHFVMAQDAELDEHDAPPDDAEVQSQYFEITGGQDTGCVIAQVLQLWQSKGLFGDNKIPAFAPLPTDSIPALHRSIAFYGGAKIGVQLPQSAMQQAQAGQPWTVEPCSPIVGGHDIEFVGYDPSWAYAVSWGQLVRISYPWVQSYVDEAFCLISQEAGEAGKGPTGLDLAALRADLDALAA